MYTTLGILLVFSVGINTWYFVLRPAQYEEEVKERLKKEVELDPLLTPGVKHEGRLGDKPDEPAPKMRRQWARDTSTDESGEGRDWRPSPDWVAELPRGEVSGRVELFEERDSIRKVRLKITTKPPKELTPEQIVQGIKSLWISSIEGDIHDPKGLPLSPESADEGGAAEAGGSGTSVVFSGKVKAYVVYDNDRIRTVADAIISLEKEPGQPEIRGRFTVSRLEDEEVDGKSTIVKEVGDKNFAILLHGGFVARHADTSAQ